MLILVLDVASILLVKRFNMCNLLEQGGVAPRDVVVCALAHRVALREAVLYVAVRRRQAVAHLSQLR